MLTVRVKGVDRRVLQLDHRHPANFEPCTHHPASPALGITQQGTRNTLEFMNSLGPMVPLLQKAPHRLLDQALDTGCGSCGICTADRNGARLSSASKTAEMARSGVSSTLVLVLCLLSFFAGRFISIPSLPGGDHGVSCSFK